MFGGASGVEDAVADVLPVVLIIVFASGIVQTVETHSPESVDPSVGVPLAQQRVGRAADLPLEGRLDFLGVADALGFGYPVAIIIDLLWQVAVGTLGVGSGHVKTSNIIERLEALEDVANGAREHSFICEICVRKICYSLGMW